MQIKIIFNNKAISNKLTIGWGFSCLVDNCVLFDTGEKPEYLLNNMRLLGVDLSCIEAVVISHDHWDHVGGLWNILNIRKGLKVYACPGFSGSFKDNVNKLQGRLIEADKFTQVMDKIHVTGEIPGIHSGRYLAEQALVVQTENGITVITGCAHPGIIEMIKKVKQEYPGEQINCVFGGFHLSDKDQSSIELIVSEFKKMGIRKAGPAHCSGKEAEKMFANEYKSNYLNIMAGQIIDI